MVVAYREKVLWKLAGIQIFFVAHGCTLALGTMCSICMVSPIFSAQRESATFLFPFKTIHASWTGGNGECGPQILGLSIGRWFFWLCKSE